MSTKTKVAQSSDVKQATVKPVEKKSSIKKEPAKKPAEKKPVVKKEPGVSDILRKIMVPKEGNVCAVTYGEANAAIKKAFPKRLKLYQSEFDRNFDILVKEGKLKAKKPIEFKIKKEKEAKPKAVKAAKKVAEAKK